MNNNKNRSGSLRDRFQIPVDGKLYETSEEVYKVYYKMGGRRERYLEERSLKNELSFDALLNAEYPVEEKIRLKARDTEEIVITRVLIEEVMSCVKGLSDDEKSIIEELYFNEVSEVVLAKNIGIARTTLQSRKYKILEKIKK